MATMVPGTEADNALFKTMCARAHFASSLADNIQPYAFDPIPPPNSRGGRNAEGWRMVFSATIAEDWGNMSQNMHGAAVAWIVDSCTSFSLVMLRTPTFWGEPMISGVTLTLDTSVFNPAPVGMKVRIVVTVERLSVTFANLRCDLTEWDTGRRLSSGTHCKTWKAAPPSGKKGNDGNDKAKL